MQHRGTLNRVELIGWLGQDPETRFIPSGAQVSSFRLATRRPSHDPARDDHTEWHAIECWETLAAIAAEHLRQGRRVRVEGHLITQQWEDRESGQRRSRSFVRAETILFLDDRRPEQPEPAEALAELPL